MHSQMIDTEYLDSKAWPFVEARALLKKRKKLFDKKGYALFQTGYGPSGLPHIGTFGEVCRTTMVIQAFQKLTDIPVKLLLFQMIWTVLEKSLIIFQIKILEAKP